MTMIIPTTLTIQSNNLLMPRNTTTRLNIIFKASKILNKMIKAVKHSDNLSDKALKLEIF